MGESNLEGAGVRVGGVGEGGGGVQGEVVGVHVVPSGNNVKVEAKSC